MVIEVIQSSEGGVLNQCGSNNDLEKLSVSNYIFENIPCISRSLAVS